MAFHDRPSDKTVVVGVPRTEGQVELEDLYLGLRTSDGLAARRVPLPVLSKAAENCVEA